MDTLGSVSASFLAGFTVSSARLAYLDICDGCTTVTRMFQTQLFVNIVGNVFSVTFMMLSAFNTLMSDGTNTIRVTLYFLYDSLMRTLQMYFIIDACHTTVEQVNSGGGGGSGIGADPTLKYEDPARIPTLLAMHFIIYYLVQATSDLVMIKTQKRLYQL